METITLPHRHIILPFEICRGLGIEARTRLEVDFDDKAGYIRLHLLNYKYKNVPHREKLERKTRRHHAEQRLKAQ